MRSACAWVAGRARSVRIDEDAVPAYAATLPATIDVAPPDPATELLEGDREARAAFVICLDAINFGSGWWPTIRKRPGRSGYFTIAAGLTERFRESGPWSPSGLASIGAAGVATVLGQDPDHPLMTHYAAALRDVGGQVEREHGGRFEAVIEAAAGSAVALAGLLAGWRAFADVSTYDGRSVTFFKRAQIAAADVARAGLVEPADLDRLTAFADNLVPHVLRLDGVLQLDPEIDGVLWNRGGAERYKRVPRPRSRNTAY